MKKFYIILMTILLVLTMTVSAGATEADEPMTEDVTEVAETVTEAVESMTEETATEAPEEEETVFLTVEKDIWDVLNEATPEQIEEIKQYIIYGISVLPFPDQVRAWSFENLNAIAWIAAGVVFVIFFIGNLKTKKSISDSITTNNNNLVEAYTASEKFVGNAEKTMTEAIEKVEKIAKQTEVERGEMLEAFKGFVETVMVALNERSLELIEEAKKGTKASISAIEEAKKKETGLTESVIMMATVLCDLVQNSSLPQWKKDEFTVHLQDGLAKIAEVTKHDDTEA